MGCYVDTTEEKRFYMLIDETTQCILDKPTGYLKHLSLCNKSPNSIKRAAFSLSYYFDYLEEDGLSPDDIFTLRYDEQMAHFTSFLLWLKSGKHTKKKSRPSDNTCNAYLDDVFRYYSYLKREAELDSAGLKVLEPRTVTTVNGAGVRVQKTVYHFNSPLAKKDRVGPSISKDNLDRAIEACTNIRDKLLLLLWSETGFRIGELLGVHYLTDIDYEKHTISVTFRDDNANGARAKNREDRTISIRDTTFSLLNVYIAENRHLLQKTGFLFVVLSGKTAGSPLTAGAVYSFLKRIKKKTGMDKLTPHMIRHHFSNERLKKRWSIPLIGKALGHKHISTTERYLNVESEELYAASEKYYREVAPTIDISNLI